MAFGTSNVQTAYFGNLKVLCGQWTGVVGDAPGTIKVEGGQIYLCQFSAQTPAGTTYVPEIQWNPSVSGAVTTVTINNVAAVTAGNFIIIHN